MNIFEKNKNRQVIQTALNRAAMYNTGRPSECNSDGVQNVIRKSKENEFEKGGEGSRGGKVIGHTKSGKPVYEKYNSFPKDHNKQDFIDAGDLHSELAKKEKNVDKKELHKDYASTFKQIAAQYETSDSFQKTN